MVLPMTWYNSDDEKPWAHIDRRPTMPHIPEMKTPTLQIAISNGLLASVDLDKQAALDIMIALSEFHGRVCSQIGGCGDMDAATAAAPALGQINTVYQVIEAISKVAKE